MTRDRWRREQFYAYDGENRLLTVTDTPHALSGACDTSLTLTTGGTGTRLAQTSEAGVYRFEAERHVSGGAVFLPCRLAESGKLRNATGWAPRFGWV